MTVIIESEHFGSSRWYWSIGDREGYADSESAARLAATLASIDAQDAKEDKQ